MKGTRYPLLSLVIVAASVLGQPVQTAQTGQKKWPPLFPRAGAQKLYEDDRVIVWDDVLSTEHFMHRHLLDSIYFYIEDGPIESMDENGKITTGAAGGPARPVPRFGGFTKGGRGPHSERSLDPNKRRRMFRIEYKGTQPPDCKQWSTDPICN